MSISEDELAELESIHCAPSDIEGWAPDCYLCGDELPCDVLRLIAAYREQARQLAAGDALAKDVDEARVGHSLQCICGYCRALRKYNRARGAA